jgi:methylmalonic aciduria homocystinuria type C protein
MIDSQAPDHERISGQIRAAAAAHGLDLARSLRMSWYNDTVPPALALPNLDRPAALALILGNTRALWPRLASALAADPALASAPDPVDRYCERVVRAALAGIDARWLVRFAHEPPPRVAIQRLAHVAGLAYLAPSHLSVHPVYGPWIALRAVVVIDVDGPPGPAPTLAPPCDCAMHCAPRFQAALARAGGAPGGAGAQVESDWRAWLAVRDACPIGRAHRYSEEQLRYHYTKDRRSLPGGNRGLAG